MERRPQSRAMAARRLSAELTCWRSWYASMGKVGALAMVKAAVGQGVLVWACAAVMRGWMACSAGTEAAEEAAAPYRWDTRVEELVDVEAEGGLVEVGAGVPGFLGGENEVGGGRGDREVLHGPGG